MYRTLSTITLEFCSNVHVSGTFTYYMDFFKSISDCTLQVTSDIPPPHQIFYWSPPKSVSYMSSAPYFPTFQFSSCMLPHFCMVIALVKECAFLKQFTNWRKIFVAWIFVHLFPLYGGGFIELMVRALVPWCLTFDGWELWQLVLNLILRFFFTVTIPDHM